MARTKTYYRTCKDCDANLDPGEVCSCSSDKEHLFEMRAWVFNAYPDVPWRKRIESLSDRQILDMYNRMTKEDWKPSSSMRLNLHDEAY